MKSFSCQKFFLSLYIHLHKIISRAILSNSNTHDRFSGTLLQEVIITRCIMLLLYYNNVQK